MVFKEKYKLNKDKNIGSVIYIVEGNKREINLIYYIFEKVLNYSVQRKRRDNDNIRVYESNKNKNSIVYIINSENSNIKSINNEEFIDEQLQKIMNEDKYINYHNFPIYYIFDCDRNKDIEITKTLIKKYNNSRISTDEYSNIGGLLLLSFPSIESLVISCFEKKTYYFFQNKDKNFNIKQYNSKYNNEMFNESRIIEGFNELIEGVENIGILNYNLDDMTYFNLQVLDKCLNNILLSEFLLSFLDLGIIEEI